jgi:DNA-binding Lrp family transcriptional regulator
MKATFLSAEQSMTRLDRTDRKILASLQQDGRMTVTNVADRVSLSVSRTQRRLRELENSGIIRGYRADVDPAALGYGFEVILFATLRDLARLPDVDAALEAIPQVVEAQRLFGDPDYLLRVREADLESYQHLYDSTLATIPGIARMTSTIVMKTVVPPRPVPTI